MSNSNENNKTYKNRSFISKIVDSVYDQGRFTDMAASVKIIRGYRVKGKTNIGDGCTLEKLSLNDLEINVDEAKIRRMFPIKIFLAENEIKTFIEKRVNDELSIIESTSPDFPKTRALENIKIKIANEIPAEVDEKRANVINSLDDFLKAYDLETIDIDFVKEGSFFSKFVGVTKELFSKKEFKEVFAVIKAGLESAADNKTSAESDKKRLEAAAALITSIGDDDAVIQIGTILLVKNNKRLIVTNLNNKQLNFIEKNPYVLKETEQIHLILSNVDDIIEIDEKRK